ncbi:hypothetical protein AB0L74_30010 [Streptomyces sp. NPDC052020]|uniref:hypothetical protein n=1 Tax=Streptomyces sp. NPDC052020 TaxID=3155677 RepID=UPI003419D65E
MSGNSAGIPSLILTGGQVLTMDPHSRVAEAVAIRSSEIVAVGADHEIRTLAGPATRVVELGGRTVLPCINDSHLHGAAYGLTRPPFALDVGHPTVGSITDITPSAGKAASAVTGKVRRVGWSGHGW